MSKSALSVSLSMCVATLVACTEPGQMTGIGAVTGGVVGAGLGAMIGNQTGDSGAGLVIGAAAGAGAGAAVGNVLEAQDQAIRQQDEAIERQEQVIRAQRGELDQLRRLGQDSVRFRGKTPATKAAVAPRVAQASSQNSLILRNVPSKPPVNQSAGFQQAPAARSYAGRAAPGSIAPAESVTFKDVPKRAEPPAAAQPDIADSEDMTGAAVVEQVDSANTTSDTIAEKDVVMHESQLGDSPPAQPPVAAHNMKQSADCQSAETEYQQAAGKSENPDKLFHIRRALRLCPEDARFHSSLGDIYSALGRGSDAKFEYQEALRLSPGNAELKKKVESLPGNSAEQY